MKQDIHPNHRPVTVSCTCGAIFELSSTIAKDKLEVEVCSSCHPFYTGSQKIIDTAGRVEKFRLRYAKK